MRDACDGITANENSTANIPIPDPSFICANPADYDGSHEFDSNEGATMTCDSSMSFWAAKKGQVLYDFLQTKVCDDNAITYLGNMVTVGCCGPGKQHACDATSSTSSNSSTSNTASSNSSTARGASGGGWVAALSVAYCIVALLYENII